jgi:chitin disaccharide deacetylase
MLPQILRITVELAKEYGIPAVRLPREVVRIYMLKRKGSVAKVLQLSILNLLCRLGKSALLLHPDHFVGFFFGGNLHKRNLQKLLQHLPPTGTTELMCHPGLDDPSTHYSHWGYHWSEELCALVDSEITDFLRQQEIQLISYRHFA